MVWGGLSFSSCVGKSYRAAKVLKLCPLTNENSPWVRSLLQCGIGYRHDSKDDKSLHLQLVAVQATDAPALSVSTYMNTVKEGGAIYKPPQ